MSDKSHVLSPEALDFAPGLLSIQESPPARLPRAVMYTVTSLFVILMLWAIFGKLNIIASAEGQLVPQTYVKIVQPSDAGIVQGILVKEGEAVSAGQVLMRMDTKLAEAETTAINNELAIRSLQLRRIDSELNGTHLYRESEDHSDLFQQVDAQYRDHRQSYLDALEQAKASLTKAQHEYNSAKEVLAKLKETTSILRQEAEAYAAMGTNGYAPQVTVRDKHREYLEKAQDLRAQVSTVASLEAAIKQARKQIDMITSKYRSDLRNERMEAEGQYLKLRQDWIKQEHKSGLLELKAPQAGIIKDLATHTIGTVVSPGTVLLSIVPEHEPLVAEINIKNYDVGFVYLNQRVKVKLATYPFEVYGMLDGEVIHIGPDALAADAQKEKDSNPDKQQQSIYKAIVALDHQSLNTGGIQHKLVSGMQVVAEIDQGRRTVMQYLLSPVTKTLYESGRER